MWVQLTALPAWGLSSSEVPGHSLAQILGCADDWVHLLWDGISSSVSSLAVDEVINKDKKCDVSDFALSPGIYKALFSKGQILGNDFKSEMCSFY